MAKRLAGGTRRRRLATALTGLGVVLVLVGIGILVPPLLGVLHRSSDDHELLQKWLGSNGALTKVIPGQTESPLNSGSAATAPACGSGSPSSEYALVSFPSLPGIEGVAGNGSWAMLTQRSVVHYSDSPPPGGVGNVLIALHREPNFEPLNQLRPGDQIVVTARNCERYVYTVTRTWVESPDQVTQLASMSSGHYLTVITCTPLWVDTERIVIRATLTATQLTAS